MIVLTILKWVGVAVLSYVLFWIVLGVIGRFSKRRKEWAPVLEAEIKRWSAKTCDQLVSEIVDVQAYDADYDGKQYQVEVQLLENTPQYVRVLVSVDDGTLPASASPLGKSFLLRRDDTAPQPSQR